MQEVILDLSVKPDADDIPKVYVKQGDTERYFRAVIQDRGVDYAIPAGTGITVWFAGTGGQGNYASIDNVSAFSVSGNKVTVRISPLITATKGGGIMCLVMVSGSGDQIGTWDIQYMVEGLPGVDGTDAEDTYAAYRDLLAQAVKTGENYVTDKSLQLSGKAADAAVVGKMLHNQNLLDNWHFADPVNQRGAESYSNGSFTIDRWKMSITSGTVSLEDGYISISAAATAVYFMQAVEGFDWKMTYTISVLMSDNSLVKATGTYDIGVYLPDGAYFYTTHSDTTGLFSVNIKVYSGTSTAIKAVKLEYGAVSTLENDAPPDKALELLKCQRYYIRYATNSSGQWLMGASNGSTLMMPLHLPVPLRGTAEPSIHYANVNIYPYVTGEAVEVTGVSVSNNSSRQSFMLHASHANGDMAAKEPGALRLTTDGWLSLSCEI